MSWLRCGAHELSGKSVELCRWGAELISGPQEEAGRTDTVNCSRK